MTSTDFAAYEAKCAAAKALAAEALPVNKAALFAALAAAGIHTVVVTFDGCGDSGQTESITGLGDDNAEVDLPSGTVELREVNFNRSAVVATTRTVRDTIEMMTFDFLEETHDGWKDGDGAYGEFTFSTAGQSITLDYNERRMESDFHTHEF